MNKRTKKIKIIRTIVVSVLALIIVLDGLSPWLFATDEGIYVPICEQEEHLHTEACYQYELICTLGDGAETDQTETIETDTAETETTETETNQVETEETEIDETETDETEVHEHTNECYEEWLICEIPEHSHDSDCYPAESEQETESETETTETEITESETETETETEEYPGTFVYEDKEIIVTAQLAEKTDIPGSARLRVVPFDRTTEEEKFDLMTREIQEQMMEEDQGIHRILFYDIAFVLDDEEIEPKDKVTVSIKYKKRAFEKAEVELASDLLVLHIKENEDEIEVEDVKPKIDGVKNGVTSIEFRTDSFSVYAVVLEDQTVSGTFYKKVEAITNTGSQYLIVATHGSNALNDNASPSLMSQVLMMPVKGVDNENREYFTTESDITSSMLYKFDTAVGVSGTTKIRSEGGGRNYVGPVAGNVFSAAAQNTAVSYKRATKTWIIEQGGYAVSNDNRKFSGSNAVSTTNKELYKQAYKQMLIYEQVEAELFIPADMPDVIGSAPGAPELEEKPDYAEYIAASEAKTGTEQFGDKKVTYASDEATSQIEADEIFNNRAEDDGKVWTDKSVIYKQDDYNAFKTYEPGEFGITLSALSQIYTQKETEEQDIPVDVVFVLDVSGSMQVVGTDGMRAVVMATALNNTISRIMNAHPANRVGIALFSDESREVLDLGRYYCGDEGDVPDYENGNYQYFTIEGLGQEPYIMPNKKLRDAGTKQLLAPRGQVIEGGTNTQHGIQHGANIFLKETNTTYETSQRGIVKRLPVMILLSDGKPTFASPNFMNPLNGPNYGNGHSNGVMDSSYIYEGDGVNAKGIMGYYTVLSANYFKSIIGIHYGRAARFSTVGMGILKGTEAGGLYASAEGPESAVGDDYNRAVLNPSAENLQITKNNKENEQSPKYGPMMVDMLQNNYQDKTVMVRCSGDIYGLNGLSYGHTSSYMPVLKNPFTRYNYADSAYFGDDMSKVELTDIFNHILKECAENDIVYSEVLKEGTLLTFTDPLGDGMEVKGEPVLRYKGENYPCTEYQVIESDTSIIRKYWTSIEAEVINAVGQNVSLRDVEIEVVIDADGAQTVIWKIGRDLLPAYREAAEHDYYFEMLPIRLLFKVGPQEDIASSGVSSGVYYTNKWQNNDTTTAVFEPHENNTYYQQAGNLNHDIEKTVNTTLTRPTYFVSQGQIGQQIKIAMGNNGKLEYQREFIDITVQKKWMNYEDQEVPQDGKPAVRIYLYRQRAGESTGTIAPVDVNPVELPFEGKWEYTWKDLPPYDATGQPYSYYIFERGVSSSQYDIKYQVGSEAKTDNMSELVSEEDAVITVYNKEKNPPDEYGVIAVNKRWEDSKGNELSDTSKLPAIEVTLKRRYGYIENEGTLLEKFVWVEQDQEIGKVPLTKPDWTYTWDKLLTVRKNIAEGRTYYYYYYIEETIVIDGYEVSYSDNNIIEMTDDRYGLQNGTIAITNRQTALNLPMPETGGMGHGTFLITGFMLMLSSAVWKIYQLIKRREERLVYKR